MKVYEKKTMNPSEGHAQQREEEKKEAEEEETQIVTYQYGHLFLQKQALLPTLSLNDFFLVNGFHTQTYLFDLHFWLQVDSDTMFVVDDHLIESFMDHRSGSA